MWRGRTAGDGRTPQTIRPRLIPATHLLPVPGSAATLPAGDAARAVELATVAVQREIYDQGAGAQEAAGAQPV